MGERIRKNFGYLVPTVLFLVFTACWLFLRSQNIELTRDARQLWGATYQILALYGAIVGFLISRKWGGWASVMGKAVCLFSLGLLFQTFGQTYSSYFVFSQGVEAPPYPGIGDIGFFGSVLLYIWGVITLSKVSGVELFLRKTYGKVIGFLIPIIVIVGSYTYFLGDYVFDLSDKFKVFLDLGYPIGQAIYVSIAIICLIASRNLLGGIMRKPVLLLIFALLVQYFSDFMFLYEASRGSWYVGNINDYLYLCSYFLMTVSLITLGISFKNIQNT